MDYELIINFLNEHNDASILLTQKYKPKEVLFLYKAKDLTTLNSIESYYKDNFSGCFLKECVDNKRLEELEKIILKYKNKKPLLNLACDDTLDALIFYTFALKSKINCEFLDIKNKKIFNISLDKIKIKNSDIYDLDIEDVINSVGGSIVVDSSEFLDKDIIYKITSIIANNLTTWEKYRIRLSDSNLFIHDIANPHILKINLDCLNVEETCLINKCLSFLKENGQISYSKRENYILVNFLNDYIKSFIFKSGTWFEVFTKLIIREISSIDEVKSGVVFLWSRERNSIRNELDVLAVRDSVLTCISCKDSKKYDEVALNELNIYADQLGGENVKKILVSTMEPSKGTVMNRAKEMGIKIIIYNGNKNKFKKDLQNVICK